MVSKLIGLLCGPSLPVLLCGVVAGLAACALTASPATADPKNLHLAASRGDAQTIANMLNRGVAVDAEYAAWPPLLTASYAGALPSVETLLSYCADPNASDAAGVTPLIAAIAHGSGPIVAELLRFGADPTRVGASGLSARGFARLEGRTDLVALMDARSAPGATSQDCGAQSPRAAYYDGFLLDGRRTRVSNTGTIGECAEKCLEAGDNCKYFNYVPTSRSCQFFEEYVLVSQWGGLVSTVGVILQSSADQAEALPGFWRILGQVDLPGGDLEGVRADDLLPCMAACNQRSDCAAMTYVGQIETGANCWLKSRPAQPIDNDATRAAEMVSAWRVRRPIFPTRFERLSP